MSYDPNIPKQRYDNCGDKEWLRLEGDGKGELLYSVHIDIFQKYIKQTDKVFEIGAGSGRYTKDLVNMCAELTVADISSHQIEFNKMKMKELGVYDRIKAYHVLDLLQMENIPSNSFDCIVCVGGVINYLLDKEYDGIRELLRILKPNGKLVLGVMSFIGSVLYYLQAVKLEKDMLGMQAIKWLFETGIQDEQHYPVPSKHYVHMMRSAELDKMFAAFPVKILEKRSAGIITQGKDQAVEFVRQDSELWKFIVEKEIEYSKLTSLLDCGMNILYIVEKV